MPLEQEEIDFLGQQIDRQYAELLEEVREELAHNGGGEYIELLNHGGCDAGEEAVRDLLWGLNSTLFDRHIREIRDIEKARMRIREREYGICGDCGEDIPYERLKARPVALRCVYCQSEHEHSPASRFASFL
jgi:RNA polymerase-binding protein DksA